MSRQEQITATMEALRLHDANNTCMTVEECADYLNVHKNTVLNRIRAGDVKAILVGRTWRIPKIQFLEKIVRE